MANSKHVAVLLELQSNYRRHTEIFSGVQKFAEQQGWTLTIDEYIDDTLSRCDVGESPYDGIVARVSSRLAAQCERHGLPAVNVWLNSPVKNELPGVFPDFGEVGRLTAEHLLARGYCRFATLTSNTAADQMARGSFAATVNEQGFDCQNISVPLAPAESLSNWRQMQQIIQNVLDTSEFPIGFWAYGEHHGRILAQECANRGLSIPADVAIVAGSNEATFCLPRPSLTSVELGIQRIGYKAAEILDEAMQTPASMRLGGNGAEAPHVILPPEGLIQRASTDFFAVEDKLVGAALEYISRSSHRQIDVNDVARSVSAEPRTLQRYFRRHLNRPVAAEIRRVRIERAKRQLVDGNQSMSEIARAVGFGTSMRMYEVFRRELGITPTDYRKQRRLERLPQSSI